MEVREIKYFIEAALLAAGRPLSIDQLQGLFDTASTPEKAQIREALKRLGDDYEARGLTIGEVASGFRLQIRPSMAERLGKLWEERPPRYSRALFETLALIAYRQPMTRGEIEEIRGVAVSANIIRTLQEREWVRVVGHRDVPGRPAMFATTREFLDYFGLKKLNDLPPLADLSDWETLRVQLNLPAVGDDESGGDDADLIPPPLALGDDEGLDTTGDDDRDGQESAAVESKSELAGITPGRTAGEARTDGDDTTHADDVISSAEANPDVPTGTDDESAKADLEQAARDDDESPTGAAVRNG